MFGLGNREIIIIAIVLVLLFGAKKIPELAKNVVDAFKHLTSVFKSETYKDDQQIADKSKQK